MILVVCVAWSAIAWSLHQIRNPKQQWVSTWSYLVLLAGIALVTLQIVSLPQDVLAWLSPHQAEILPLWQGGEGVAELLGTWSTLSLTPAGTRTGLITIVTYSLLFVITVQRIRSVNDAERMLRWVAGISVAMAVFGLAQYLTSNGKYYWFLQHYQGTTDKVPLGAFPNRNHFAQFLALGFAPLLVYVLSLLNQNTRRNFGFERRSRKGDRSDVVLKLGIGIAALAIVAFTLLFSLSRGGMVALATSVVVCVGALYCKRAVPGQVAAVIASVGVLIGGFVAIHGYDKIATRLDNWETTGRLEIWEANAKVVSDFPAFGTGIGSHRFAHKLHWDHPEQAVECSHAESSLVQITSECGLAGIAIVAIGVVTCFGWCVRGLRRSRDSRLTLALAAVTASLAASLIHSIFDVVWHIPGIMVSVVVLAACACRLFQLSKESAPEAVPETTFPSVWGVRLCGGVAMILVVVATGWVIQTTAPKMMAEAAQLEYLNLVHAQNDEQTETLSPLEELEERMALLEKAVELAPENSDLQRHLAFHYFSVFEFRQADSENPMSAAQIQEAVIASQFSSVTEMQAWLDRAIGDNAQLLVRSLLHAKRALSLCPLHASAYVHLADLGFLENPTVSASSEYLAQARLVYPTNAYVQFTSGRNAWMAGDIEQALEHWKVSFRQSSYYRQRIVEATSESLSARFLLDNFDFDWQALEELKLHYQTIDNSDELRIVLTAHARGSIARARSEAGRKSAPYWLAGCDSLDLLERPDLAEQCLIRAHKSAPHTYEVRLHYGSWLLQRKRFAEAAEHLTWCTRRRPNDTNVLRLAERAVKAKIQFADSRASRYSNGPRRQ
jgi:tetratricopeptide (TPR) repeat protein